MTIYEFRYNGQTARARRARIPNRALDIPSIRPIKNAALGNVANPQKGIEKKMAHLGWMAAMSQEFRNRAAVKEFGEELRKLTRSDANDFHRWLNEAGIACDAPSLTFKFAGE